MHHAAMTRLHRILGLAVFVSLLFAPPASAQEDGYTFDEPLPPANTSSGGSRASSSRADSDGARIGLQFDLAFAGAAHYDPDGSAFEVDVDLAPTFGFGLRFEYPILRYLAVGALFAFRSFNPDDAFSDERQEALDIDALIKGRLPMNVGGMTLIPYLALPIGGTVWFIEDNDNYRGINTGLLAGAEFVLDGVPLSLFTEIGWRAHRVARNGDVLSTHQFAWNIGAMFVF